MHQLLGEATCLEHVAHGVCVHLLLDHRQRIRRAVRGDVLREGDRARQQLLGGDDLLHQSERRSLVGVEHPAGQQQVKRGAVAHDAREYPGDAVLGDQPAPREGSGELGAVGCEPDVAHQRLGQPDARARAVDRCDDRFAQRRHEMRMTFPHQLVDIRLAGGVHCGAADSGQIAHVGAGAERTSAAGDHDRANVLVGLGALEARIKRGRHSTAPGVHARRAVEGQHGHAAVGYLAQHRVGVGGTHRDDLLEFGSSSWLLKCGSSSVAPSWMYGHTVHLSVVPSAPAPPVTDRSGRAGGRRSGSVPAPRPGRGACGGRECG